MFGHVQKRPMQPPTWLAKKSKASDRSEAREPGVHMPATALWIRLLALRARLSNDEPRPRFSTNPGRHLLRLSSLGRVCEGDSSSGTAAMWVAESDCGRVLGWKIDSPKRMFSGMATIVHCNCGAEYRRTEEKFLVPHTGDAVCTVCGAALESWRESLHVPTYELIERPERKPE